MRRAHRCTLRLLGERSVARLRVTPRNDAAGKRSFAAPVNELVEEIRRAGELLRARDAVEVAWRVTSALPAAM